MTTSKNNPIIIIGSGMAGYTLARELRKLNADLPITLICKDAGDSYAKPTLSNAFAQGKTADKIANATAESMAETLTIKILNFYQVSHIDSEQKTITIHPVLASDKQEILPYSKLVLATGANSRQLAGITVDNEQIFAVNHLADYTKFQQKIHTLAETLAEKSNESIKIGIIGAGLIGCEFANDLIHQAEKSPLEIHVFDKSTLPMAGQLPSIAGEMLQSALTSVGVNFHLNSDILSVKPVQNHVEIISKTNEIEQTQNVDLVLLAVGLVANTALAENAGLNVAHLNENFEHNTHLPRTAKQGIIVDKFLQTSMPDIYAIGDCANVAGSFMPYVMPLMNQAKALAITLSNSENAPTAVSYPAMPVAIKTPSLPLVVLPVSAKFSDDDITWQTQTTTDGAILTAVANDNPDKLLGFVLAGKEAGKQRMTLTKQVDNWL